jgi:hypothetical protein
MVVAVILQINNRVTVIAVRGTQFLYDWALNLKAWHSKMVHRLGAFHHGFLREAASCFSASRARSIKSVTFKDPMLPRSTSQVTLSRAQSQQSLLS